MSVITVTMTAEEIAEYRATCTITCFKAVRPDHGKTWRLHCGTDAHIVLEWVPG